MDEELWNAGYSMDEEEYEDYCENGLPYYETSEWDDSDDPYND